MTRAALLLLLSGLALAAPAATTSGGALPVLPEAETPAVARGTGVAELPLLVTEPPKEEPEDIPAPVTGDAEGALNPFAPLILPGPDETAQPAPIPAQRPLDAAPAPESTPSPAALEPAAPPTAPAPQARVGVPALPGALSARMQPVPSTGLSTGILKRALATTSPETDPNSLAQRAVIRVPSGLTPLTSSGFARRGGGAQGASSTGLTPIGLAGDENVTLSVSNRVSRSLADLRVHFTAMTTGTGIFRVGDNPAPILVAVGERLPGTELVLSRLTSSDAQFSEDDARHTLLLNP